jgi:Methyltransferase domain
MPTGTVTTTERLKHRIGGSRFAVPARRAWRAGWAIRRFVHRSLDAVARRQLYGSEADVPEMEFPPGHYHSPIPSAAEVAAFASATSPPPTGLGGIDLRHDAQMSLLGELKPLYDEQPFTLDGGSGLRYRFRNDVYPAADALVLSCMLRHLQPSRIIEVGSGWSTCVMLDTLERSSQHMPTISLVEPYPERLFELIHPDDHDSFVLDPVRLQDVPVDRFRDLQANDILFVDSTHVTKVGSDVNHLLFEILPALRPGVFVHIHDIHYPFEYTTPWIADGRYWNEAYMVRAFLEFNDSFDVVLFVDYLRKIARRYLAREFPLVLENPGVTDPERAPAGSLWLARNA